MIFVHEDIWFDREVALSWYCVATVCTVYSLLLVWRAMEDTQYFLLGHYHISPPPPIWPGLLTIEHGTFSKVNIHMRYKIWKSNTLYLVK